MKKYFTYTVNKKEKEKINELNQKIDKLKGILRFALLISANNFLAINLNKFMIPIKIYC